jgi:DNA-binding transcriptional regulator GbsR (MarR family)
MKSNIISEDLRWRVVYLHNDGYSLQEISELLKISAPTVTRIMKCFQQWRCVINPLKGQAGRRKIFNGSDMRVNFIFFNNYLLCVFIYYRTIFISFFF